MNYGKQLQWKDVMKETELVSITSAASLVDIVQRRLQARIPEDLADDDTLLNPYANAAEKLIEDIASITLREKTFNLHLACWPSFCDYLVIPLETPPIKSITHIKYYDTNDVQQTLSSSLYETWFSSNPAKILIKAENVPLLSYERSKVVEIRYIAGYASDIPPTAELLILELVAFWYKEREAFGRMPTESAQHRMFQTLLDGLRWRLYP